MKKSDSTKIKFPDSPGVYLFKKGKSILYIGKATSLKDRIKSYFSKDLIATRGPLLVDMVFMSDTVDFIKTDSVLEALILEAHLIKTHQPKYNTKEKDNKSYYYVVITQETLPKILLERGKNIDIKNKKFLHNDIKIKSIYGPFPHGTLLKEALKIIRKIFPFLDKQSAKSDNHEFYKQIGLVPNINDSQSIVEYSKTIRHIELFFQGKKKDILKSLEKDMYEYAKKQQFERAQRCKNTLYALEHIKDISLLKRDITDQSGAMRIEGFDVAHTSGKNMVGVMTVIINGVAEKAEYRKFIIKTVSTPHDPQALREILLRRFSHPEWPYPNIIVVDGATIQKNVAEKVLLDNKLDIAVVAVVKDERHKPKDILGKKDVILSYRHDILLANAESHRYALSFHRQRRGLLPKRKTSHED